ncbi:cytochrome c [Roseateles sp.]|uniref:c-type cytochrome n=1 Tax=Roseateles sp. TaxID=1971397 RepID=UPI002E068626|nr:cytochrome c [Roseateles sp.]
MSLRQRLLWTSVLLSALAAGGFVIAQPKPVPQQPPPPASALPGSAQVEHGRYLAAVGDCVACHTAQGGVRFAGGRPVPTPFGTLLSANLTPDVETGIGRYTADTFYRALHEGIDHDGRHLYPAFPYNYYTRISRADADALFAYFRSLAPVQHAVDRNQLRFPFNIRGLMAVWNWMYLDTGTYRSDPARSPLWNRGAYLVEGLGHCQACHTPRNSLGGAKKDEAFQGGRFGDWFAPDITPNRRRGIGGWDRATLTEFLRDGRNVHSAASGEMGEVVAFSTSQMTDGDLAAVADYLGSLPASPEGTVTGPSAAVMNQGEAIWQDSCSACHRMQGQGVPRVFPPLKGNPNVQQSDPTTVLHFVLAGTRRVPTAHAPTPLAMPAFDWKLSDGQIAAVATYVRNSWGNAALGVQASDVAELRARLATGRRHPDRVSASGMDHPGAATLAPADTDSRDNGSTQAGRKAPASSAPAGNQLRKQDGHPSGAPTGGPG